MLFVVEMAEKGRSPPTVQTKLEVDHLFDRISKVIHIEVCIKSLAFFLLGSFIILFRILCYNNMWWQVLLDWQYLLF
jgi:hypothetical protein